MLIRATTFLLCAYRICAYQIVAVNHAHIIAIKGDLLIRVAATVHMAGILGPLATPVARTLSLPGASAGSVGVRAKHQEQLDRWAEV